MFSNKNKFYFPCPDYGTRLQIFKAMIKKYGGYLLSEALKLGFRKNTKKVWLHTCSLDHKHALKNYLGRGMKIFKSESINLDIN